MVSQAGGDPVHICLARVPNEGLPIATSDYWVFLDEVLDSIAFLTMEYSLLLSCQLTVGIAA